MKLALVCRVWFVLCTDSCFGWVMKPRTFKPMNQKLGRIRGGEVRSQAALEANMIEAAATWLTGIRVPSTLVAGSALTSLMSFEKDLHVNEKDTWLGAGIKRSIGLLLISAFLLEILCVYATTVTSTWLLSNADHPNPINAIAKTGLGLMHRELEFEYVLCRLLSLQGLFNWVAALGLKFSLPSADPHASTAEQRLARFYGRSVLTILLLMLHYFQYHVAFYDSYLHLIVRFWQLTVDRLFATWPPGPLLSAAAGVFIWSVSALFLAVRADLKQHHKHFAPADAASKGKKRT